MLLLLLLLQIVGCCYHSRGCLADKSYRNYAIHKYRQKRRNDQLRFDQLQHIVALNWDKFGTLFGI